MTRSKDIGTSGERAVVNYLREHGWPGAERRALHGNCDLGDITGTGPLVWEVKSGEAAKNFTDGLLQTWIAQTEAERANAKADIGILVMARRGFGATRTGQWWAVMDMGTMHDAPALDGHHVITTLASACHWLRYVGYGTPL